MKSAPCAPAKSIGTVADLQGVIQKMSWSYVGRHTHQRMEVSVDLTIKSPLSLVVADIPLPKGCQNSKCPPSPGFDFSQAPSGVKCEAHDSQQNCSKVYLPATTLRLRLSLVDRHPGIYYYIPLIEILPPCKTPCSSGEFRCKDNTCWKQYSRYCQYCLEKEPKLCACQESKGKKPDKATCGYFISNDATCNGTCQDGVCHDPSNICP